MIGIILLLEVLIVIFLSVRYVAELYKATRGGAKVLQEKMNTLSKYIVWLGIGIIVIFPRILNVKYKHDDTSSIMYIFISTLGFIIFYIGSRLRIYSYRKPEETPKWMKKIVKTIDEIL